MQCVRPALLMLRADVPVYDERMRSGAGGRAAQAMDAARHLNFAVHPTAFVIALPRPGLLAAAEAAQLPQVRDSRFLPQPASQAALGLSARPLARCKIPIGYRGLPPCT